MEEEFIDIRHVQEQFEKTKARFLAERSISQKNKDLVLHFVRDAALGKTMPGRAKKKIGPARLLGYILQLRPLIDFLDKDLDQVTQEDMEDFIEALESDRIRSRARRLKGGKPTPDGGILSYRYKVDIKMTVKKFYKWLWGECKTYPQIVEWIDTFVQPKEISALSEAEVNRMLDIARRSEQRAIIQVFFDGGFRIAELLNVRLHHVSFRSFDPEHPAERCFVIRIPFSKTLRRTVVLPMHASSKWLSLWLEEHPAQPKIRPDGTIEALDTRAPLFPMTENAVRLMFNHIGERALKKRVYPHLMRHSSATYWSNRLPYFKFCKRFGWTMTSKMPQRYIDREGVDELDVARIYRQSSQAKPNEATLDHAVSQMED